MYDLKTSHNPCPACGSVVQYRYGNTQLGKPRLQCLLCGRQFTVGAKRVEVLMRPNCPGCGEPMHLYKRENRAVRYRCSNYPVCKTFKKIVRVATAGQTYYRFRIPA